MGLCGSSISSPHSALSRWGQRSGSRSCRRTCVKIGDSISWTSLSICGRGVAEVEVEAEVVEAVETAVEVVAAAVAEVAGGHLHKEGH